jgi:hypothetical protein
MMLHTGSDGKMVFRPLSLAAHRGADEAPAAALAPPAPDGSERAPVSGAAAGTPAARGLSVWAPGRPPRAPCSDAGRIDLGAEACTSPGAAAADGPTASGCREADAEDGQTSGRCGEAASPAREAAADTGDGQTGGGARRDDDQPRSAPDLAAEAAGPRRSVAGPSDSMDVDAEVARVEPPLVRPLAWRGQTDRQTDRPTRWSDRQTKWPRIGT